jgi:1,4-alpha-glucan branching enzyme
MTSVKPDGRIEFRFYRPRAKEVSVAGSFNGWSTERLKMSPQSGGWWSLTTTLPEGDHRFRYCADGEWYTDFAANGVELEKGVLNSLLTVGTPKLNTLRVAA